MAWVYLDLITLNSDNFWLYSDSFPPTTQVIKFVETLVVQGSVVPPENVSIRALMNISQNENGIDEHTESIIIYPSNNPIIYRVPLHTFSLPRISLKLLTNRYNKYNPLWAFNIYYWEGTTNGTGTGINSTELSNLINNLGVGGGGIPPELI